MPSYTFHARREASAGDARGLDDAVLVRDGFSVPALVFTVLWALWHRMWLVALIILAVKVSLIVVVSVFNVSGAAAFAADLLVSFYIGLEAAAIRSWHLTRKGKPPIMVVIADDEDGAETKAMALWAQRQGFGMAAARPIVAGPVAAKSAPTMGTSVPVIGLFPDSEVKR